VKTILVIGGGIIGLCTAYYAMRRGHKVTVVERGGPDHDCCSLGNAGMIVPSHFVPLAAPGMVGLGLKMLVDPEGPFAIRLSLDPELLDWCWKFACSCTHAHVQRAGPVLRDLNLASRACYEELSSEPGADFGLTQRGLLMLCKLPETLREESKLADSARGLGLAAEVLDSKQAAILDPGLRMDIAGAVYFPQDCHLTPYRLVAGLTRVLQEQGVHFHWNTEVHGVLARQRCVEGVTTSSGALTADETVIAGGAWSSRLARSLGLKLPMQAGKGYSITVAKPRALPGLCSILAEARIAVTPMGSSLRFAGTMEITGLDPSINQRRVDGIIKSIPRYFPDIAPADFAGVPIWSGLRPCSPDGLPYIGRFRRYDNLSVATAHSMMGLSLGPITGKLVAEILSDEQPSLPIDLISPDRYEGSSARSFEG
jgi:D-amino-acid dehydrogenase